jgi:hypothetical protein
MERSVMGLVHWIAIHWFELCALVLLIANLWFVSSILEVLRETNRWLDFLTSRWDQLARPVEPGTNETSEPRYD